jgi:hypothetical protein
MRRNELRVACQRVIQGTLREGGWEVRVRPSRCDCAIRYIRYASGSLVPWLRMRNASASSSDTLSAAATAKAISSCI